MKNSIQFKHFRKFEDFSRLEFNDITFVVGKNNSGKSTFVKAFVMIYNYLKSGTLNKLDLNQQSVELLNIVTFDRALCKTMTDRIHKDSISINVKLGNYEFFLEVTGRLDSTILSVSEFRIVDYLTNFTLTINPLSEYATISFLSTEIKEDNSLKRAVTEKEEIENNLSKMSDELSKESIEMKSRLEKLVKTIDELKKAKNEVTTSFTVSEFYSTNTFVELFEDLSTSLNRKYFIQNPNVELFEEEVEKDKSFENDVEQMDINKNQFEKVDTAAEQEFDDIRYYYLHRTSFESFFKQFLSFINYSQIFYLPATLNKQSALLSLRDKNNDLAEVVHKYYQLGLNEDVVISSFVKYWLNEFQIGEGIDIKLVNGEAYSIEFTENKIKIPLADKGMGSIQAVLLILRLASVVHFQQLVPKKSIFEYFVIVEEPELNLHPALQSKLCDLFLEVYEKYKIKFIIETHSEYIIRRSQVMNAKKEYALDTDLINPTPFSTIYFNSDLNLETPAYSMNYQPDGTFEKAFGKGFFDASSSSTLELIKLKRRHNQNL